MWCSGSPVKCEQILTLGAITLREIPRVENTFRSCEAIWQYVRSGSRIIGSSSIK